LPRPRQARLPCIQGHHARDMFMPEPGGARTPTPLPLLPCPRKRGPRLGAPCRRRRPPACHRPAGVRPPGLLLPQTHPNCGARPSCLYGKSWREPLGGEELTGGGGAGGQTFFCSAARDKCKRFSWWLRKRWNTLLPQDLKFQAEVGGWMGQAGVGKAGRVAARVTRPAIERMKKPVDPKKNTLVIFYTSPAPRTPR